MQEGLQAVAPGAAMREKRPSHGMRVAILIFLYRKSVVYIDIYAYVYGIDCRPQNNIVTPNS